MLTQRALCPSDRAHLPFSVKFAHLCLAASSVLPCSLLGFKFLVVIVDICKLEFPHVMVAPSLMLAIHASMLLLSVFARP